MQIRRKHPSLSILFLLLLCSACTPAPPALHHEQLLVFGTLVDISIYGAQPSAAHAVISQIRRDMERQHRDWHAWQPGALSTLNAALARGEVATVPTDLRPMLVQAIELSQRSGGLFNPALGHLIALWGFSQDEPAHGPPPKAQAIAALLKQYPTMADLAWEGNDSIRTHNLAVRLDLGAIAKGYAVDLAIARLRAAGIHHAIVNAGGNLRVIGRPGERPWRIGIRHPRQPGMIASITAGHDEAILTSGDYERYYEYQGRRYHHLIDPRTGQPAQGLIAVTVIHREAAVADAASTALFVAGPAWRQTARQLGITQVMVMDPAGRVTMTAPMARRVHFEVQPPPPLEIVAP